MRPTVVLIYWLITVLLLSSSGVLYSGGPTPNTENIRSRLDSLVGKSVRGNEDTFDALLNKMRAEYNLPPLIKNSVLDSFACHRAGLRIRQYDSLEAWDTDSLDLQLRLHFWQDYSVEVDDNEALFFHPEHKPIRVLRLPTHSEGIFHDLVYSKDAGLSVHEYGYHDFWWWYWSEYGRLKMLSETGTHYGYSSVFFQRGGRFFRCAFIIISDGQPIREKQDTTYIVLESKPEDNFGIENTVIRQDSVISNRGVRFDTSRGRFTNHVFKYSINRYGTGARIDSAIGPHITGDDDVFDVFLNKVRAENGMKPLLRSSVLDSVACYRALHSARLHAATGRTSKTEDSDKHSQEFYTQYGRNFVEIQTALYSPTTRGCFFVGKSIEEQGLYEGVYYANDPIVQEAEAGYYDFWGLYWSPLGHRDYLLTSAATHYGYVSVVFQQGENYYRYASYVITNGEPVK